MNKETYKAWVICRNCEYGKPFYFLEGGRPIRIPRGKKVEEIKCPNCGCKELYFDKPRYD